MMVVVVEGDKNNRESAISVHIFGGGGIAGGCEE
jgi:hypothetical protein